MTRPDRPLVVDGDAPKASVRPVRARVDMSKLFGVGRRSVRCYKAMAIPIVSALRFCAGLEAAAFGMSPLWSVISKRARPLPGEDRSREKVSYYASREWAERYWDEHALSVTTRT